MTSEDSAASVERPARRGAPSEPVLRVCRALLALVIAATTWASNRRHGTLGERLLSTGR
jgi:hypothetical protein